MPSKIDQFASPTQKTLNLFSLLLFTGKKFSLSQLAKILECSKQTVLRITGELSRTRNINLRDWIENGQRWFQIESSPRPHVSLSSREIQFLRICKEFVWHLLPKGISEEVEGALNKTTALLPNKEDCTTALDSICAVSVKGVIDYTPFQDIIETTLRAIRDRNICEITYQGPYRPEPRISHFAPIKMLSYRESLYVVGFSVTERGNPEMLYKTTFSIQRIKSITILNINHNFEILEDDKKNFFFGFMENEPFLVSVRFTSQVAQYIKERKWSDNQIIKEHRDGSVLLEFMAQSAPEVISWILSFGKEAKLIKPKRLKQQIADELRLALSSYN